jgi:hypothetical protein
VPRDLFCNDAQKVETPPWKGARFYAVKMQGAGECSFRFVGPVLTSSARELDLALTLYEQPPSQFPLTVRFGNLEKLDIMGLDPQPETQNAAEIDYQILPREGNGLYPISMRINDRQLAARSETELFWLGIICGVLSSFMASILYDLARDWEGRL